ncbi:macrophage colony-stimulating factor 1 isoform X1 [Sarcophilus harrisii]|uniref:macrophage colony-stimulating factor 1 isoform X1 n=1 Tax=Sarcophilus harrisii TaxID=9305 RepID=UPI001301D194|nr:macrophage colony-stimulating factor 1 isoform X1 [Sarcophilus harrisii]XP_031823095.1 macrophage colony-stimulating factor 1 isoform X1 [Sarcophilus harrisii]
MTPRGAGGNCPLTIWLGCWLLLPCLLVWSLPTYGPETCDHLIGEGHLMKLQQLIDSQMETSCHITFKFADRDQLAHVFQKDSICYLKKAFPLIQDIFEEIIRFKDNSSNYNASRDLHELYLRLRDAGCVTREHEERDEACVRTFNNTPVQILEKVQNIFVETNRLLKDDWRIFDRDCTSSFAKCVSSDVVTKPDCNCLSPRTTPSSKLASVPIHSSLSPSTAPVANLAWGDSEGTEGKPLVPSDLPPQTTAQGSARRRVPRSTCGSVEAMETAGTLSASQSLVGSEMEPGSNKSPPDLSDSPRIKGLLNSALDTDSALGDASGDVSPGSQETEAPLFLLGGGPIQTGTTDPDELLATPSTPVLAQGPLAQVRNDHLQNEGSTPLAGQARDYSSEEMDGGIQGLSSPTTQLLHSEETQGISNLPAQPRFPRSLSWGVPRPPKELEGKRSTRVRRSPAKLEGGRGGQGLEREEGPGGPHKGFNSLPLTDTGPERQNMGSPVLQFQGSDFWVLIAGILLVLLAVGGLLFYKQRQRNRQELQPAEILLEQPEIRSPLNQEEDRQVEMPV